MPRSISPRTSLENLKKEAKRLLKALRAGDPQALADYRRQNPNAPAQPTLRDVQHAMALRFGVKGWTELTRALALRPAAVGSPRDPARLEQLARDLVRVYATGDAEGLDRLNSHFATNYTADDFRALVWRLIYKVRWAKGSAEAFQVEEAREWICRASGYPNWAALLASAVAGTPAPVSAYDVATKAGRLAIKRFATSSDWDAIIGAMKEHRIPTMRAEAMSDDALRRLAEMDFITSLEVAGSRGLTDDGLRQLARMPQLERLDVSGCKVTDRGLEVLRRLPNLRSFQMNWQTEVSDAGVANLRFCERIETVSLMGSPVGDGAIEALRGKPRLRVLRGGTKMTDVGLHLLRDFPVFRTWQGGDVKFGLMSPDDQPNHLLIDGPVTDSGLAELAALEGLAGLTLFWHVTAATPAGLAVLPKIPRLLQFRCDGKLVDDRAMSYIAAAPMLRMLVAQGSAATDAGFVALGGSTTLEQFWGREAPGLGSRGFRALAKMPALRGLGVSLANVADDALSLLPTFPALREFASIAIGNAGFRHLGRCRRLERLWCMYCRDTTDAATEQIADLRLKHYYAGLTAITDESLRILGRMTSLEKIELYECKGVTDAGLAFLASLPKLRAVEIFGMPKITPAGAKVFPHRVKVTHQV